MSSSEDTSTAAPASASVIAPASSVLATASVLDPASSANDSTNTLVGQVKWFNVKAGYGFVTVVTPDSEHKGKDIFVHYSALNVENTLYRYLVQGEYVQFTPVKANNDKYELHASGVSGLYGGTIMCENRVRDDQARGPRERPTSSGKYDQAAQQTDDDGFQKVPRRNTRTRV